MKKLVGVLVAVWLAVLAMPQVEAQEGTVRLYIVPSEMYDPGYGTQYFGPLYFKWRYSTGDLPRLGQVHYGFVSGYIVAAELTQEQHDWLVVQPGAWAFPVDLDANIEQADMEALRARFEGFNVPSDWLTAANTYREMLHSTHGVFDFAKRYTLIAAEAGYRLQFLFDTVDLDTRYRDFPALTQEWFEATIASYGYDPADVIKANSTMRQMLKQAGDLIASPLQIAGQTY